MPLPPRPVSVAGYIHSTMRISEPFPIESLPELHRWLALCPGIVNAEEFPKDWPAFEVKLADYLPRIRSWAVYAEDGRLSGAVLLEPLGEMAAQAYVASGRWAWGEGLLDQAVRVIMAKVFIAEKPLAYVIGMVKERNRAALRFNERNGMRVKNRFPGLVAFELTREQWLRDVGMGRIGT